MSTTRLRDELRAYDVHVGTPECKTVHRVLAVNSMAALGSMLSELRDSAEPPRIRSLVVRPCSG